MVVDAWYMLRVHIMLHPINGQSQTLERTLDVAADLGPGVPRLPIPWNVSTPA
jgi:hypothetical protein